MLWVRSPSACVRETWSALKLDDLSCPQAGLCVAANSGSAPIIFTDGLLNLIAVAIPLIMPPAAHRSENGFNFGQVLKDLEANGALAGDNFSSL